VPMYLTLAVSGPGTDAVTAAALAADPALMPVPGPPGVAWRSADGRSALLTWPAREPVTSSYAGSIVAGPQGVHAVSTLVNRVYECALPGGTTVLSDRATWTAAATGRLGDIDPLLIAQLLNVGYPLGTTTPYRCIRAHSPGGLEEPPGDAPGVAEALTAAVAPLAKAASPVELSLTGGKDSRLVAAALVIAGVPFRARTHGFDDHPDVVVAAQVAAALGVEHLVATPSAPGDEVDPLARIRSAVLVGDGMISAFENIGRPDPARPLVTPVGGHGGELLRGGYAEVLHGAGLKKTAGGLELLRRMTARRTRLLRPSVRLAYVASLRPWFAAMRRGPATALDDFYLINRAGRWSAAARAAYLIREDLAQPLFDDAVVQAARAVPLRERISGQLIRDATKHLRPDLLDIPFAGKGPAGGFDWRRDYGPQIAEFFRDYILSATPLFTAVSRPAVEHLLAAPKPDPGAVWSLATLACLTTGDHRNARTPSPRRYPLPTPGAPSRAGPR
jgi:hypothetical protein